MIFLYLPFVYTFHTRLLTLSSKLAWFTTYVIPILIICFYFKFDLLFSFLYVFSIYATYELGYIFNDCELIKKEENPTLRLNDEELYFYENNKKSIFLIRFFFISLALTLFFIFFQTVFLYVLISVFLILITYTIYNNIRNNYNLPLYSFLVFLRYFFVFALIGKSFLLAFLLYLIYPFCVTLEFSTKKRFKTSSYIKIMNFDKFRMIYYIVFFIVAILIYLFSNFEYKDLFIYLSFYFFIYRLLSYVLISKSFRSEK